MLVKRLILPELN